MRKKWKELQHASEVKNSVPSDENVTKFENTKAGLTEAYEKERIEYLEGENW